MNYYNDIHPKSKGALEALMQAGVIPKGHIDTRSIEDVTPADLSGYKQCHFFAGIGGWPIAFRWAGIPDDLPYWSGSCPCQPFSCAGKRSGQSDERHLWPCLHALISKCRPLRIFGEQVEAAIGWGWLDGVCSNLEASGYACGTAVLGAHSVGAPQQRQRIYWVADADGLGRSARGTRNNGEHGRRESYADGSDDHSSLANRHSSGFTELGRTRATREEHPAPQCTSHLSPWAASIWWPCQDGLRRVPAGDGWLGAEPELFPLAPRLPSWSNVLFGAGNAIVPQVATEFILACQEVL